MSTIVIEIETDSPAFRDGYGNPYLGPETARILHKLAEDIEQYGMEPCPLRDLNDNTIGRLEIIEGKIPTRDQLNDWLDVADTALAKIRKSSYLFQATRLARQALAILGNRHTLYHDLFGTKPPACQACAEEGRDRPATGYFDKPDPETGFTHLCDEHIREHDNRHGG